MWKVYWESENINPRKLHFIGKFYYFNMSGNNFIRPIYSFINSNRRDYDKFI